MIRNNLQSTYIEINGIRIQKSLLKNSIEINFLDTAYLGDFFIALRSYSDSAILRPYQLLLEVHSNDNTRKYFSHSLSIKEVQSMSFLAFSDWYSKAWNKNSQYLGDESFSQKIIFIYLVTNLEILYPKYPWSEEVLTVLLNESEIEKDERIKLLEKRVEELLKELEKRK